MKEKWAKRPPQRCERTDNVEKMSAASAFCY